VTRPTSRPFSTTGSFFMLRSNISLAASPVRVSCDAVTSGLVIMSMTFVVFDDLDSHIILLSISRSVRMPTGFSWSTTSTQPISWRFMSSAACLIVAFGAMVTTFSTMIFRSFCDMKGYTCDVRLMLVLSVLWIVNLEFRNQAPPSTGSSPMIAGKTQRTIFGLSISLLMLSLSRFIMPVSLYSLLSSMMPNVAAQTEMVRGSEVVLITVGMISARSTASKARKRAVAFRAIPRLTRL
jgi:hypothetical protein